MTRAPTRPEHVGLEEHRGEEDAEGEEHLNQVLHVTQEQVCAASEQRRPGGKEKDGGGQQRGPQQTKTEVDADQRADDQQRHGPDRRVERLRERRSERQHLARKIDLRHQVRVSDQAGGGKPHRSDEEGPRNRLHRDPRQFLHGKVVARHVGHGKAHERAREDDQHGHEHRPAEPHDRLLVTHADIAPGELVCETPVGPELVDEDLPQVAPDLTAFWPYTAMERPHCRTTPRRTSSSVSRTVRMLGR